MVPLMTSRVAAVTSPTCDNDPSIASSKAVAFPGRTVTTNRVADSENNRWSLRVIPRDAQEGRP